MLLHSPIRDVYLCIQGFDSRLACRICNNTVQSRIRADGRTVHQERRRWRECDKETKEKEQRKKRKDKEKEQERKKDTEGKKGNCRETDAAQRVILV